MCLGVSVFGILFPSSFASALRPRAGTRTLPERPGECHALFSENPKRRFTAPENPNVLLRFDYVACFIEYPKSQSAVLTLPKIFDSVSSGCATVCNALPVQNCRLRAITFWACWRRPGRGKSSSVTPPLSNWFRWRARPQPITPHQKAARVMCCTTQGKK
jgi:hypothetical protein